MTYGKGETNGIISKLCDLHGRINIHNLGIIHVFGPQSVGAPISDIISRINRQTYCSINVPNASITIDFRKWSVKPTHYVLKRSTSVFKCVLLSWVLEGSNDKVEWFCLDERRLEDDDINLEVVIFRCWSEEAFRFIRLRQIADNRLANHQLALHFLDLFGTATYDEKAKISLTQIVEG